MDDFGRQPMHPMNCSIAGFLPWSEKTGYLTLHTREKVCFAVRSAGNIPTNLPQEKPTDPPQLRRVHYKMKINPPSEEEYKEIFQRICDSYGLGFSEDPMDNLFDSFYSRHKVPFAGFHPKFITENVIAAGNYLGTTPQVTQELLADSLENMVILAGQPAERE